MIVISGCGHPGVGRLMQRAAALFEAPVVGFVGGMHCPSSDGTDLQPLIDDLHGYQPRIVAPSAHDSSQAALDSLRRPFPEAFRAVVVGEELVIA